MILFHSFNNQERLKSLDRLLDNANTVWWNSPPTEWKKAFAAHPKIGDAKALKEKFAKSPDAWEGDEQKGADDADEVTLQSLAKYNNDYYSKFGFIFLICATGKTAAQMLEFLMDRINNDKETEVRTKKNIDTSSFSIDISY